MANRYDPIDAAWQVKPSQFDTARNQCIRTRVAPDQPFRIRSEPTSKWRNAFRILTSQNRFTCSGRFNLSLQITPMQVCIGQHRWTSPGGKFGRGSFHIPIFDELGDGELDGAKTEPIDLHIRCTLPFLHPFVPLHIEISLDKEIVYTRGKFTR